MCCLFIFCPEILFPNTIQVMPLSDSILMEMVNISATAKEGAE
tara:strand:- start:2010 stop:2138 length:129 start_codon:yes stop_codon:yes gene_type:complete